jgi:hypothetical protein
MDGQCPKGRTALERCSYMALMCCFRAFAPDGTPYVRAAIAGAPAGDWSLYDTCYTERYGPRG